MDWTSVPGGELGRQAFVDEMKTVDDRAERYFLELKSDIDLSTKEGQAKVAKFILGAANRDAKMAARRFGGHALMVLGVSKGAAPGIPFFEAKDLQKVVTKFISHDGPKWDFNSVRVDDTHSVVIIEVAPPVPGVIWTCHAFGLDNLEDGAIYIRADGETRKAAGGEVRAMLARAKAATPDVKLELEVVGMAHAYHCDDSVVEQYIDRERAELLQGIEDAERAQRPSEAAKAGPAGLLRPIAPVSHEVPERRTPGQFKRQIESWAQEVREAWPVALDSLAAAIWGTVTFEVHNPGDSLLEDLEVEVHIPGKVDGLDPVSRDGFDFTSYSPDPPQRWGPRQESYLANFTAGALVRTDLLPYVGRESTFRFENGGSVTVTIGPCDLRPGKIIPFSEEMCLVLREPIEAPLLATWTATVRGHDRRYHGEVTISVALEVADFSARLRRVFKLSQSQVEDVQ